MIVLCGLHLVRDEEPNQRDARRERRHRAGIGSAGGGRADDPRTVRTLKPGEGAEIKLLMKKGAKANYTWTVAGGVVNFRHARRRGRTRVQAKRKGVARPKEKA